MYEFSYIIKEIDDVTYHCLEQTYYGILLSEFGYIVQSLSANLGNGMTNKKSMDLMIMMIERDSFQYHECMRGISSIVEFQKDFDSRWYLHYDAYDYWITIYFKNKTDAFNTKLLFI